MNWHTGNIAEAVAESKAKDAIFVVYIQGQDDMSAKLDGFVDDVRVRSKLETSDFVAIKITGDGAAYGQFISIYKVVPIPSIFFIGKSGTPLDIATGIIASVEELVAKINKVLVLSGKAVKEEDQATASSTGSALIDPSRSIAGADSDETPNKKSESSLASRPKPKPEKQEAAEMPTVEASPVEKPTVAASPLEKPPTAATPATEKPTAVEAPLEKQTEAVGENSTAPEPTAAPVQSIFSAPLPRSVSPTPAALAPSNPLPIFGEVEDKKLSTENPAASSAAAAAEKRAAAAKAESSPTPSPSAPASLLPSIPLPLPSAVPTAARPLTDSEMRLVEVQNTLEEKKREEQRREKDNELRRRREAREAQTQQVLTKDQELKLMQERLRRERQEELETRERIRAQIAADRLEQSHRTMASSEVNSLGTSVAPITAESSLSSVEETRLQIRLPGGIHRTQSFPAGEILATVRVFVRTELLAGSNIRDFTLATSYPRREFQTEDEQKTLNELNLVPNAVVLVLTKEQVNRVSRTGGSIVTMLVSVMWAMLTPAAKAFEYLNKMGLQRVTQRIGAMMANIRWLRPQGDGQGDVVLVQGDAAARRNMDMFVLQPTPAPGLPTPGQDPPAATAPSSPATANPVPAIAKGATPKVSSPQPPVATQAQPQAQSHQFQQRPGGYQPPRFGDNIRRLQDTKKDDKDNKATYNGNSTQQQ